MIRGREKEHGEHGEPRRTRRFCLRQNINVSFLAEGKTAVSAVVRRVRRAPPPVHIGYQNNTLSFPNQNILLPTFIWYIIGAILFLTILVFFFQERLIFKPEKLKQDFKFKYDIPFREYFFDIEPGVRINGLHFYRDNPKGLILYFHGNTRSIKGWARYAKDFYRFDYDVVLLDYRGFGKSTGKRSEREMLSDMQFIYDKLKEKYTESQLIVYGRSMGSGFATKLASDNKPRYLILDAPYFNFLRVIERFLPILPIRIVLRFHLRTDKWIPIVKCHTYILHGTRDWLIPIRHSEELQKLNPHKITLIRIHGGGHNNLPGFDEYHNFIRDILKY